MILAAEESKLHLFRQRFPAMSLSMHSPSISFAVCWLRILLWFIYDKRNEVGRMLTKDFSLCFVSAQQVLLKCTRGKASPVADRGCPAIFAPPCLEAVLCKVISTTEGIQHCWSNPYLHFIVRTSPGKMTMWSFAMLSTGFSKNLSSARPDPNKEEIIVRQAIHHG